MLFLNTRVFKLHTRNASLREFVFKHCFIIYRYFRWACNIVWVFSVPQISDTFAVFSLFHLGGTRSRPSFKKNTFAYPFQFGTLNDPVYKHISTSLIFILVTYFEFIKLLFELKFLTWTSIIVNAYDDDSGVYKTCK